MSGASDKARFYLEQTVPELREWERRGIFSKSEISSIAAKRSDFEHVLNARGSKATDYAKYAEYEMNLDALRRKRVKRKGVKATAHTGQKRIFSILDRGTKKFHGDLALWMQYADFCRRQHANQRLSRVLTDVLRLHPTRPELWIYAARYAMDVQADVEAMRSAMQRGLRFCRQAKVLYLEYARLEMNYVAKFATRRRILGLDAKETSLADIAETNDEQDDMNADTIALPSVTAGELAGDTPSKHLVDDSTLENLASTPALKGAIPSAIFDAAMKQFPKDGDLGRQFFDMFAAFFQTPCVPAILQHVIDTLISSQATAVHGQCCRCRLPVIGISVNSAQFPSAVRSCLQEIKSMSSGQGPSEKAKLASLILSWLEPLALDAQLGPEVQQVLGATVRRLGKEKDSLPS